MGHLDIKKMLLLTVNRAFLSYYILSNILYRELQWFHLVTSIRMSIGLFTTITGLGRKNWRSGFRKYYSGIRTAFLAKFRLCIPNVIFI